jgi:hypothetical protein
MNWVRLFFDDAKSLNFRAILPKIDFQISQFGRHNAPGQCYLWCY